MNNKELLSVCFTGTCPNHTRTELMEMVAGKYEVKDSVTKDLDILVCADPNAGSSKLQKAEKNDVKIMSYEDFLGMLGNGAGDKENAEPIKPTEQDDIRKQADNYLDKEDYQKALELYLKLADQNDAEVWRRIGYCYDQQENYTAAIKWWEKAAKKGNARAQRNMGNCYYFAEGVEKDFAKAVEWYTKAAEQGDAYAQFNLGGCYEDGEGVEKNYKLAVEWYTKAAEQGNADAQCNLGYFYENGNGVKQDYNKAVELYTKAAEQGEALGQYRLGYCYYYGRGVKVNYDKAIEWFSKEELCDDSDALNFIGCCYECKKEFKKAAEWYAKAAEQGNMHAQKNLGNYYQNGTGVEQDYEKAAEFYKKSAEQGHKDAKKALDDLYEKGLVASKNVPKMNDAEFGKLTYYGKKGWKGKITANFNNSETELAIELEGSSKDAITDAQQKAYAEYLTKKDAFFSATQKRAKEVYKGAKDHDLLPKTLYIDREGNYGWKCYTPWNDGYNAVILSDGEVQMAQSDVLYNYKDALAIRNGGKWEYGKVYINLFGQLTKLYIERADDEEFDDEKFTHEETELLEWLINDFNTEDIADDVLEYCNSAYEDDAECQPIVKNELLDELHLEMIYLCTKGHKNYNHLPTISIAGEWEFDPDHGIAICFRDKKFIGVGDIQKAAY